MRKTLLLFTGSYPYAGAAENGFLPQELGVLSKHFERIVVVPMAVGGARAVIDIPNVTVDTSYAGYVASTPRRTTYMLRGLADPPLVGELGGHALMFLFGPRGAVRAVRAHVDARLAERWVSDNAHRLPLKDGVICTWWFEGATLGLARFGRRAGVPVVTRAHGRDVYEFRHNPARIPFRESSLEKVDVVFSASHAGARYLTERHPSHRDKIRVGLLGVEDPGFVCASSTDGVFRLVSCSVLVPVKRVDLMIDGIAAFGRLESGRRVQWTHIGVGRDKASLVKRASATMPANVEYRFAAYAGKQALYDYYRTTPVDLFLNTSANEGTSVAIMEAISVGIPVVATSVGGNTEIVGAENGLLVGANPAPAEIAEKVAMLARDEPTRARLRAGSREKWRREYSLRNYDTFAETLRTL